MRRLIFSAALLMLSSQAALPQELKELFKPTGLQCDYLENPLGIDNPHPRLTWRMGDNRQGARQTAYQVIVSKDSLAAWIRRTAQIIKSIDPNHLVSTGSEGKHGCEEDLALFERIHAGRHIDYLNIHIWPYNWGWVDKDGIAGGASTAAENTKEYIDEHLAVAKKLGKPLVYEAAVFEKHF